MKKKLRDMVVGDKFIDVDGDECLILYIDKKGAYAEYNGDSRYTNTFLNTEYEMVEPEPEWLYECIDTGNDYMVGEFSTDKTIKEKPSYIKIKGGRKMHPETFEIVD